MAAYGAAQEALLDTGALQTTEDNTVDYGWYKRLEDGEPIDGGSRLYPDSHRRYPGIWAGGWRTGRRVDIGEHLRNGGHRHGYRRYVQGRPL